MKYITLTTLLFTLISCGGKHGEKDLTHLDVVKPSISLIGSDKIEIPFNTPYTELGATSHDQRDGDLSNRIIVQGSVDNQVLGTYTLTYIVRDNSLNEARISREVKVIDIVDPIITLNGSSPVEVPVHTNYTEQGAIASDDYDGNLTSSISITGNVNTSKLGTYTVTYSVSDSSGNQDTMTRSVIVKDITKPTLTLLGNNPDTIEVHSSYIDLGAIAVDDYEGDISSRIQSSNNLNTAALGTYTFTYNVSDLSGNIANPITKTINVVDTTSPVLQLTGNNPLQVELGDTYTDPGVTVSDNYDPVLTASELINNINMNSVGDYQIIFKSTDSSGNTTQITRDVHVRDTTPPAITINPTEIVYQLGSVPTIDSMDGVTATDLQSVILNSSPTVNPNAAGTTTVTYSATDASGNISTSTRTYKILDMPFLSMAKDSNVKLDSMLGANTRGFYNYSLIIKDDELFEVNANSVSKSTSSYTFTQNIQPIIYNEEAIPHQDTIYVVEDGVGIHALDTTAQTLTPVHVTLSGIPGNYQVDKAIMTTKGLFFSIANSVYYIAPNQTIASNVVTLDPLNIVGSTLNWTATGKYLVTYEYSFSTHTQVNLYNVESNNSKSTLGEYDTIFHGQDPDYNSSASFHSDGETLYIRFDNYYYALNETQITTFDQLGSEDIYFHNSDLNFMFKVVTQSFNGMFVLNNNLYGFYNNGQSVYKQYSTNAGHSPFTLNLGTPVGTEIHKLISEQGDKYFMFYKDMAGSHKISRVDLSSPPQTQSIGTITVYDTINKQEITLTGDFEGVHKYNGNLYLMPESNNPLFNLSSDPNNKLIKLKLP